MDEERFSENEDTVRTAMLFALGYLYENRSTAIIKTDAESSFNSVCTERGCDVMEIGNLNQRITILEHELLLMRSATIPLNGKKHSPCWAKVTVKTATETTDAGVTKEVQKLEFLVRQSPASLNINSTNFVLFREQSSTTSQDYTGLSDHNDYLKIEGETRKAGVRMTSIDNLAEPKS